MPPDPSFDPRDHRVAALRSFDELRIGEIFRAPSRTVTDANFAAFQAVSLDNHPIHYDVEYCKALGHPAPLAHGLQVLALRQPARGFFRMSSARL